MRIAIVEDEPFAQRELKRKIEKIIPDAQIAEILESVEEATAYFSNQPRIDLVFLDIQLADGSSFELLDLKEFNYSVIFTTAYDEFALKAFEMNSIDYLLKPIDPKKLERAIVKWEKMTDNRHEQDFSQQLTALSNMLKNQNSGSQREHFLVKTGERFKQIATNEMAFFIADKNDVEVVTSSNQHFYLDYTLEELEEMLPRNQFYRINRSMIVNSSCIDEMQKYGNGQLALTLNPSLNERVLVSRSRYQDFLKWMGK